MYVASAKGQASEQAPTIFGRADIVRKTDAHVHHDGPAPGIDDLELRGDALAWARGFGRFSEQLNGTCGKLRRAG